MKLNSIVIAILIATLMLSCHQSEDRSSMDETVAQDVQLEANKMQGEEGSYITTDTSAKASSPNTSNVLNAGSPVLPEWDKKIIKTANVTLELKSFSSYNNWLHNSLKAYGAYIATEEQMQSDERIGNSVTIKVPVDKFEDLMNSFNREDVKVIERRISSSDVTGEVVDTKSRIEAKKEVRERYLDLLKQAKNMKEILEVQKEINAVQEDLESAKGRVNYLVHQSAYSTIHLSYYQNLNGVAPSDPTFFTRLGEAFKNGSSIVTGFLLFVVTIWPVLLLAIIAIVFLKRYQLKKLSVVKKEV